MSQGRAKAFRTFHDAEPWERQRGEGPKPFRLFAGFRDMRDRSLRKYAADRNIPIANLWRFSVKHNWIARAQAYDDHIDREAWRLRKTEILAAQERAAQQARAIGQMLMLPSIVISRRIAAAGGTAEALQELTTYQLMKLAIASARALPNVLKAEALALGDVTAREEHVGPDGGPIRFEERSDLSKLSLSELDTLEGLLMKVEGRDPDSLTAAAWRVEQETSDRVGRGSVLTD